MIIQYDTRPDATVDEKLRSLIESIQLALGEIGIKEDINVTSQSSDVQALSILLRELQNEVGSYTDAITGISGRVDTIENTSLPGIGNDISGLDGRLDTLEDTSIPNIQGSVSNLAGRVSSLETRIALPTAPLTDGVYKLTVTVTNGTPIYTWESA